MTLVSICIPTYNRADKLSVLLESIAAQTDHALDYDVVVSDNASTDDTAVVVDRFRSAGMAVTYLRSDVNQGFDRNILKVVTLSSSEFCWLFGSDDFLEPGAFARLEQMLLAYPAVTGISVGLRAYNADLSRTFFIDDGISTRFDYPTMLTGREDIVSSIGDRFGYISSTIIRRRSWLSAVADADIDAYLNGYVHIYVLAELLDETSSWLCVPDPLVGYRTGNDSFQGKDDFARVRLDIVGYDLAFGNTVGRSSASYRAVMRRLANSYLRAHFVSAKLRGVGMDYWRQAIPISIAHYRRYPGFWLRTLPIVGIPRFVVLGSRWLYRHTIKAIRQRGSTTEP